jgi:hypothetical protein
MSESLPIQGVKKSRVFKIYSEKKEEEKIQKGIYCFLTKNNCVLNEMKRALHIYAKENKMNLLPDRNSKKANANIWYANVSNIAQNDFEGFKEMFNSNKKKIYNKDKEMTYDRWYEESSMDGSFAYNESADDF